MMPHSKYYEEFFYFWIPKNPFVWEESYYTNLVGSKIYVYSKQGYLSFNSFACGQFWVKWLTMQEKENGFALHCVQRVVVIAIKYCTLTKIRGSKIRFSFICHENCARPSSSMMGYSPIAKKSPIDQMGKTVWGKLMVFFPIRSIYLNGTN